MTCRLSPPVLPLAGGFTEEKKKLRTRSLARYLLNSVLDLGPTFIKLGQLSSTRADLFPAEFVEELSTLQVGGGGQGGTRRLADARTHNAAIATVQGVGVPDTHLGVHPSSGGTAGVARRSEHDHSSPGGRVWTISPATRCVPTSLRPPRRDFTSGWCTKGHSLVVPNNHRS